MTVAAEEVEDPCLRVLLASALNSLALPSQAHPQFVFVLSLPQSTWLRIASAANERVAYTAAVTRYVAFVFRIIDIILAAHHEKDPEWAVHIVHHDTRRPFHIPLHVTAQPFSTTRESLEEAKQSTLATAQQLPSPDDTIESKQDLIDWQNEQLQYVLHAFRWRSLDLKLRTPRKKSKQFADGVKGNDVGPEITFRHYAKHVVWLGDAPNTAQDTWQDRVMTTSVQDAYRGARTSLTWVNTALASKETPRDPLVSARMDARLRATGGGFLQASHLLSHGTTTDFDAKSFWLHHLCRPFTPQPRETPFAAVPVTLQCTPCHFFSSSAAMRHRLMEGDYALHATLPLCHPAISAWTVPTNDVGYLTASTAGSFLQNICEILHATRRVLLLSSTANNGPSSCFLATPAPCHTLKLFAPVEAEIALDQTVPIHIFVWPLLRASKEQVAFVEGHVRLSPSFTHSRRCLPRLFCHRFFRYGIRRGERGYGGSCCGRERGRRLAFDTAWVSAEYCFLAGAMHRGVLGRIVRFGAARHGADGECLVHYPALGRCHVDLG